MIYQYVFHLISHYFTALFLIYFILMHRLKKFNLQDDQLFNKYVVNAPPVKTKVWVNFEGDMNQKCLHLSDRQLYNLRTFKKKILNQFGYEQTQIKKIQVNIMQVYPNQPENIKTPIFNEPNLKLIVGFLQNYERDIKIQIQLLEGELALKEIISQQAIEENQLHFDENGSLIQETDQMIENIPDNQKYDNSAGHIRCQFCQKNNQDKKYLKRCGGLYGPFGEEKYVHLLCALWCHRVFLHETTNLLMNVDQEISRAAKKKCQLCSEKGAGLVCVGYRYGKKSNRKNKCSRSYHFKCSYDSGSKMNWLSFKMLCKQCKEDQSQWELLEKQGAELKQKYLSEDQAQIEQEIGIIKIEDGEENRFARMKEKI